MSECKPFDAQAEIAAINRTLDVLIETILELIEIARIDGTYFDDLQKRVAQLEQPKGDK